MPMSFPNFESLKNRAKQRDFRQPNEGETEDQYRTAFADFMLSVDRVESAEIRNKLGWDQQSPEALLIAALGGFGSPTNSVQSSGEDNQKIPDHTPGDELKRGDVIICIELVYDDNALSSRFTHASPEHVPAMSRLVRMSVHDDGDGDLIMMDDRGCMWDILPGYAVFKREGGIGHWLKHNSGVPLKDLKPEDHRRRKSYMCCDVRSYMADVLTKIKENLQGDPATLFFYRQHLLKIYCDMRSYYDVDARQELQDTPAFYLESIFDERSIAYGAVEDGRDVAGSIEYAMVFTEKGKGTFEPTQYLNVAPVIHQLAVVIDHTLYVDHNGRMWCHTENGGTERVPMHQALYNDSRPRDVEVIKPIREVLGYLLQECKRIDDTIIKSSRTRELARMYRNLIALTNAKLARFGVSFADGEVYGT